MYKRIQILYAVVKFNYLQTLSKRSCEEVKGLFVKLFRFRGMPEIIRVDNGSPFGSTGLLGLTQLSVWWMSLGIRVEFIEPGHPEQNGAHERMHRTLKNDTARPPAIHLKAQDKRFDRWRKMFNEERPHEALELDVPAQHYERSERRYSKLVKPFDYPRDYEVRKVGRNGEIKFHGARHIGDAFGCQIVGLRFVKDDEWHVCFREVLLGKITRGKAGGIQAIEVPKVNGKQLKIKSSKPLGKTKRKGKEEKKK